MIAGLQNGNSVSGLTNSFECVQAGMPASKLAGMLETKPGGTTARWLSEWEKSVMRFRRCIYLSAGQRMPPDIAGLLACCHDCMQASCQTNNDVS